MFQCTIPNPFALRTDALPGLLSAKLLEEALAGKERLKKPENASTGQRCFHCPLQRPFEWTKIFYIFIGWHEISSIRLNRSSGVNEFVGISNRCYVRSCTDQWAPMVEDSTTKLGSAKTSVAWSALSTTKYFQLLDIDICQIIPKRSVRQRAACQSRVVLVLSLSNRFLNLKP